ncbi:EF-hand calcium-binding domain-containing protein 10 [Ambystoma mexicanum]|uniref:EF-hand calcium-binding domain-containing protein 10 n=1 Tax=Ambystoma mexicanum TaxID=8296 RepID=UPI0037E70C84
MASSLELEAQEYLQQNKVLELMDNLTSMLLYYRPERPREFLIDQLEKLKLARITDMDYPCLFDESNLDSVFGVLDPLGQGFITKIQYQEALNTMGIDITGLSFEDTPEAINLETFKQDVKDKLKKASATFK